MRVVGLDLAGKSANPSGFCLLTDEGSETKLLHSDEEIIAEIAKARPECIAIDAPFWLSDVNYNIKPWRRSDELLMRRGFQPISCMLPSMQALAMRARELVIFLRSKNLLVIEVFPKAAERALGLSKELRKNQDEYDALLCALTAKHFLDGNYEDLEGVIVPK